VAVGRANFRLEWNGPGIERLARESAAAGLNAAAPYLADKMARNMGSEGGGVVGADVSPLAGGPTSGRKRKKGRARYIASPPGAFPGVRTSNLRNSMAFKRATPANLSAAAGTNLARSPRAGADGKPLSPNDVDRYALFLEFGTSKMAARPFLLRTLREETPTLRRMFANAARARFKRGTGGARK
jgi:hypothetical protein